MGYITKTAPITSSQTDLTIYLQQDVIGLETAVVVGYGTQKRVNLTGAVSVVTGAELEARVTPTVTAMSHGSAPGINFTPRRVTPGPTPSHTTRGISTIN